jgi:hypothetical protein
MVRKTLVALTFGLMASAALAQVPAGPKGTKLTTDAEIIAALDGKTRQVTIYSFSPPAHATGTWDWKAKRIHVNAGKDKFDKEWTVKGAKYCVKGEPCRTIYVDGGTLYEIDPNGKVHATSQ